MIPELRHIAILSVFLVLSLTAWARDITLRATDRPAAEVFRSIMEQTDRNFVYSSDLLKDLRITVDVRKKPLKKVLDEIFKGTDIEYRIKGKNVVLKKKREKPTQKKPETPVKRSATTLHLSDSVRTTMLQTIEVVAQQENHPLETAKLGVSTMSGSDIRKVPSFLGEADVVKALQIIPGVSEANEGLTGMSVHGGNPDENLVMLDKVPLYQAEHFAGLFSPFNPEIVRSAEFYKTSIPARFDGRLSSYLDVHLRNGHTHGHHGSAKLGWTSGAFDISGPIGSRTTYLVGLRRSWYDILSTPILAIVNARKENTEKIRFGYHFMDLNGKVFHRFSDRVEGFVNLYYGDDLLKTGSKDKTEPTEGDYYDDRYDFNWGNILAQAGVNYSISPGVTSQFSASYTRFFNVMKYDELEKQISEEETLTTRSKLTNRNNIDNVTLRGDFTLKLLAGNTLRTGASYSWHRFLPDKTERENVYNNISISSRQPANPINAHQADAYVDDDWKISDRLHAEGGFHASLFHIDGKTKWGLSPRLAFSYMPTPTLSLKAAYSRTVQYVHRLEETYLSLPSDRWIPVVGDFKPITADKVGIGGYWQTNDGGYAVSLEGYWKHMSNLIDFRDEYYLRPSSWSWDRRLTSGKGTAKGIDFMIEKKSGKLTGHISYSLAWTDRLYPDKNGGRRFPARFDHRHTVKAFANWDISRKVSLSALWTGHSGNRFTFMPQRFENPSFPGISNSWWWSITESAVRTPVNNFQLPFYHRLDLSCTVRNKRGYWTFGLYNAYCNMNTVAIVTGYSKTEWIYEENDGYWNVTGESHPVFKKLKLLPIIPSISYTWQF